MNNFERDNEFRVNNNETLYPAYMSEKYFKSLANGFVTELFPTYDYVEVKVCKTYCDKGLSWRIDYYSEEKGVKRSWLSRTYTFSLTPFWVITECMDHWHSIASPRCESVPLEKLLQEVVDKRKEEMKTAYFSGSFFPLLDKYLPNSNWKNILSLGTKSFNTGTPKKDRRAKWVRNMAQKRRDSRKKA